MDVIKKTAKKDLKHKKSKRPIKTIEMHFCDDLDSKIRYLR